MFLSLSFSLSKSLLLCSYLHKEKLWFHGKWGAFVSLELTDNLFHWNQFVRLSFTAHDSAIYPVTEDDHHKAVTITVVIQSRIPGCKVYIVNIAHSAKLMIKKVDT